jgi:hypothetical protein
MLTSVLLFVPLLCSVLFRFFYCNIAVFTDWVLNWDCVADAVRITTYVTKVEIIEALFSDVTQCSVKSQKGSSLLHGCGNLKSRGVDLTVDVTT